MNAFLDKILEDDFIWSAIVANLPGRNSRSSTDYLRFNCPMCVTLGESADRRERGGVRRSSEGIGINCFAAGTMVVTDKGTLPIEQLVGKADVQIIDGNGEWTATEFHNLGKQRLYRLELERSQRRKVIYTTAGHEWLLRKVQRRFTTSELKPGHYLKSVQPKVQSERKIVAEGVKHGFVFGDGSKEGNHSVATFCSQEKKALLPFFADHPISFLSTGVTKARRCGPLYKILPNLDRDPDYIFSFLAGLFAADGCVGASGASSATLSSSSEDDLLLIRDLCTKVGITTYEPREMRSDAPGRYKDSPIFQMTFVRNSMPRHFFLNPKHLTNYDNNPGASYDRLGWKVVSVEATDRWEDVYCCEVSTTGSFMLENHILTANCFNCGFKTRYKTGDKLSRKMRAFLAEIGLDEREIGHLALRAYKTARVIADANVEVEHRDDRFTPSFKKRDLPADAFPLTEWAELGCDDPDFLKVAQYALDRGSSVAGAVWWTPEKQWRDRMILPFSFRGETVGWTGRLVGEASDENPKYMSEVPTDFLYNSDVMANRSRKYILMPEGVLDAHAIDGISPLGAKLSPRQASWIKESGKTVIVIPDRDTSGQRLIDAALHNNWRVAFPRLTRAGSNWWEADCKDCADAVKRYGRLYTIRSIIETSTDEKLKINVMRKWLSE